MFDYKDDVNKDDNKTLDEWLEMTKYWTNPFPLPKVEEHNGVAVVREDAAGCTKLRGFDLLFNNIEQDTVVYVAPREGFAPYAVLKTAQRLGKKVKFFLPSSKRMSETQAKLFEEGLSEDDVEFHRVAAMPNLNRMAAQWAETHNAFFVPLGGRHALVTAALVRTAYELPYRPKSMAVATSTGVLIRALQIAMPETEFHSVAVARNLQAGEKGKAHFYSDPRPFLKDSKFPCSFPTYNNYDLKAYEYAVNNGVESMWNVASKPVLQDKTIPNKIDSFRKWKKDMTPAEIRKYYGEL